MDENQEKKDYGVKGTSGKNAKHAGKLHECEAQQNLLKDPDLLIEVAPKVCWQGSNGEICPGCQLSKSGHLKAGESISNTVIKAWDMTGLEMNVQSQTMNNKHTNQIHELWATGSLTIYYGNN